MTWDELVTKITKIRENLKEGKITQDECDKRCRELMAEYAGKKKAKK